MADNTSGSAVDANGNSVPSPADDFRSLGLTENKVDKLCAKLYFPKGERFFKAERFKALTIFHSSFYKVLVGAPIFDPIPS